MLDNAIFKGEHRFCSGMLHSAFVYPRNGSAALKTGRQNMQIEAFYQEGEAFALIQISDITSQYRRVHLLQHLVKELEGDYESVKESEEYAKRNALYDPLTGLCNRVLFYDRLKHSFTQARRNGQLVALLFLDLDGFKAVNDSIGHFGGDLLLKEVAVRLKTVVREADTVCRLGGDEYTIILPNIKEKTDVAMIAKNILKVLSTKFILDGKDICITASIGISLFPLDGDDSETIVRFADSAMYTVKATGKNDYQFYSSGSQFVS
ncbi:Phytochrome-like protein cph2 [Sporomusa ovata DSM 2662]|uniref:Diguanylate cyclase/phosphodiesterase (GGDEF & EAL domains) with PAS/PAC sensor(S) n=1 Tax=Sporomusa ovata TaxID=2378 RepID=A0A0U1L601_9FIRM|nr:GGDEF domain-containing protein [Sporomusa ovata]EQB26123.1 diguanylate cyclase/phosphodiesterase [Sporomusa ovata DSM 2662]CQR74699.1 diguanylate cyclase/phosphodiesterase (GGDEF & EAL domains) with PAS/PAC sensor(s) [Sporomusa ovata]